MVKPNRLAKKYVPDLVSMGAHFEGNYRRLQKLMHLMQDQDRNENKCQIRLNVGTRFVGTVTITLLESARYTDTLLLEQTAAAGKWLNDPEMTVRMYHDASVAEVINCRGHERFAGNNDYPNRYMHHPDEKSQLNVFLSEWLNFCLAHGCCDTLPFGSGKM